MWPFRFFEQVTMYIVQLFLLADWIIHCSSYTRNAHVSHGSHPDKLPAGVSSGKQQPCSASPQWSAYTRQKCGDDRPVNGMLGTITVDYVLKLCKKSNSYQEFFTHCRFVFLPVALFQVPTLGSQEGAFENVRMNYSGDQGQTIRQLISAHVLRRVAMCVLSSPHGRRQHLAVSHEKGKVKINMLNFSLWIFLICSFFCYMFINKLHCLVVFFISCLTDNSSAAFHSPEASWLEQEEANTNPSGLCPCPFHCPQSHRQPL